jgi:hypothetical protein
METIGMDTQRAQQRGCQGSGHIITDYNTYTEGDEEPYLGKTIATLIVKDLNYIVYLDQDGAVEWACTTGYGTLDPGAAEVLNGVSALEAVPLDEVSESARVAFRRMLGEAVARVLSDRNAQSAKDMLDRAERYINALRESVARTWNLQATLAMCLAFGAGALFLWWQRDAVRGTLGSAFLDLALASASGVLGGFISFAYRSRQVELDPSGGQCRYYFNGVARSFGAAFGAIFVALAVKTKLVLGFLDAAGTSHIVVLLLAGMLAGVSERLVPNLAGQIEARETKT